MNIFTLTYTISCMLGFGEAGYAFDLNLIEPNNLMRFQDTVTIFKFLWISELFSNRRFRRDNTQKSDRFLTYRRFLEKWLILRKRPSISRKRSFFDIKTFLQLRPVYKYRPFSLWRLFFRKSPSFENRHFISKRPFFQMAVFWETDHNLRK